MDFIIDISGDEWQELGAGHDVVREELPEEPGDIQDADQTQAPGGEGRVFKLHLLFLSKREKLYNSA